MRLCSSSDRCSRRRFFGWPAGALAVAAIALIAIGPAVPQPGQTIPCVSRPSELRELGFSIRGTISEVAVKPGDTVKAGDRLVRLDDRVQLRAVELSRIQAEDTSKVRMATVALEYREQELQMFEKTKSAAAGNPAELREARYRRDSSIIELEAAQYAARADQVVLLREQARLEEMRIVSPIDAIVLDVHKRAGETVDEGTTVVTLISVDPLWLDVNVPTKMAGSIEVGQKASVEWEDIDAVPAMPGTVIFKSPAAHLGARQVQVRVEVPNPGKVPGGLHGNITFQHPPPTRAAAKPGENTGK